jgi:penicillin amidase
MDDSGFAPEWLSSLNPRKPRLLMRYLLLALLLILIGCAKSSEHTFSGLQQPVEITRDVNGVNHIVAQNEHDLFFTQGYAAASDRLFQFEVWRRQATGTVAEILGPREAKRDIGARLFRFRGDLDKELNHYHPHGKAIITAFTDGINARIDEVLADTALLPLEFKWLGITPQKWTPEVVISRHQGLLGNVPDEVNLGRAVALLGPDKIKDIVVFEPGVPDISIHPTIQQEWLKDSIIAIYNTYRRTLRFQPEDLIKAGNLDPKQVAKLNHEDAVQEEELLALPKETIGSNNWVVSGKLTQSGHPVIANDPHRTIVAPSLRYMVHLKAPGWNVLGGGEPTIPGVSIGHNESGAWGLTIFAIDGEDLMVYRLNPSNTNQYWYNGAWEDMQTEQDTIRIKGTNPTIVTHRYTRHGPVTFIDEKNAVGYAIRCAWLEPGGAPYLASLRIDQATNWKEFREACTYSHIPGENMIWADTSGNIGWQAVGIAPVRKWSGLVPVPGDGSHEWSGYLPISSLPNIANPEKGFWATANENNIPSNYAHRDAVGWSWADPYRVNRINEVLGTATAMSQEDLMKLQFDYLSLPARELVPLLSGLVSDQAGTEQARKLLLQWNYVMDKESPAAAIYMAWEKKLSRSMYFSSVPEAARKHIRSIALSRVLDWLQHPEKKWGKKAIEQRNQLLLTSLDEALKQLTEKLGTDLTQWKYGQANYHYVQIKHPMSNAVNDATRKLLEAGPAPRAGNASTPGMTTNSDNQSAGASFRMVVDVSNWDGAMFTNTPGQSGDPRSPYYRNLFDRWANDQHFPVYFTPEKIAASAAEKKVIGPR